MGDPERKRPKVGSSLFKTVKLLAYVAHLYLGISFADYEI